MLFAGPSMESHAISVYRKEDQIDEEGMPSQVFELVEEFRGGFGSVATSRELYVGTPSQRVDAAISTFTNTQAQIGDIINVNGRDWKCVGVSTTGPTIRIFLVTWGVNVSSTNNGDES
jgi:hypothetical protein